MTRHPSLPWHFGLAAQQPSNNTTPSPSRRRVPHFHNLRAPHALKISNEASTHLFILNFAWPLKSLDFGAFEPFGLIGKLGSPDISGPKNGCCSGNITPSERC